MHEPGKRIKYLYSFMKKGLVHLNLQILYQCNFRCTICDFWKQPYQSMPRLTPENARIISGKLGSAGPLIVSVGGGEPLLHPDLVDIISAFSGRHFPVMICNGWFMTPEKARELWKAGLYEVSISLDYADACKHDRQRGMPGAYDRALAGLEMLYKNRTGPHQRVHMISVIMDDNLDEVEPLIRIAREIGITYLVTLYSYGRGSKAAKNLRPETSARLLELRNKYPDFVGVRGYLARFTEAATMGVNPCYAGKNLFNIDCQGNVTRCIDRLDQVAGNMLSDDFKVIENNLNRQHRASDCADCWTSCRGNIESVMYGPGRLVNLIDTHRMTKNVSLTQDN